MRHQLNRLLAIQFEARFWRTKSFRDSLGVGVVVLAIVSLNWAHNYLVDHNRVLHLTIIQLVNSRDVMELEFDIVKYFISLTSTLQS